MKKTALTTRIYRAGTYLSRGVYHNYLLFVSTNVSGHQQYSRQNDKSARETDDWFA